MRSYYENIQSNPWIFICVGEDLKYVSHLELEMEQIDIFCGMKLMSTEVCFFGVS